MDAEVAALLRCGLPKFHRTAQATALVLEANDAVLARILAMRDLPRNDSAIPEPGGSVSSSETRGEAVSGWRRIGALVAILAAAVVVGVLIFVALRPHEKEVFPKSGGREVDWSVRTQLPPPVHEDFRSEPVGSEGKYRFWPRSGRANLGVAYTFDTGHCGLTFLADFDGSFWHPVARRGTEPEFFYNEDIGAIALLDDDTAVYRSSNDVEVRLRRIRGGVVTRLCA